MMVVPLLATNWRYFDAVFDSGLEFAITLGDEVLDAEKARHYLFATTLEFGLEYIAVLPLRAFRSMRNQRKTKQCVK